MVAIEEPVPGTMTTATRTQEIPYTCVKLESVSPKEFVIDPTAATIDEALGVAHIVIKPRYMITKGMKDGIYNDMPLGSYDKADFGFDEEFSDSDEDDKVKIVEYWGLVPKRFLSGNSSSVDQFDYNDDELVEAVVTIANDDCVLRAAETHTC